ncbi:MAG: response regulator transcription factor [Lachnospiraceae bacterium]|nr:response regulator transcription factor [Lachnospiraceae bacterium]
MTKLLLVEDDPDIVKSLSAYLTAEGYEVMTAAGERAAREALRRSTPALLLVDLALADGSGFGVCRAANERKLPVIFLTANDTEMSVVRGLDLGAEDYITKPFRPRELLSRIRTVLRRTGGGSPVIAAGPVAIDTESGTVTKDGEELAVSALEYRLLLQLFSNRGRLLTREQILQDIWDAAGDYVNDNTLTVYIKRLREKIEDDPARPQIIKTVRGMGYRVD